MKLARCGLIAAALIAVVVVIAAPDPPAEKKLPKLLDLGANKCIPCKKMAPILEGLSSEYRGKANVLFIDVWENKAAAETFRVKMIPTQIFFNSQGKEVKRHIGFMEKVEIIKELKSAGLK